MIKIDENLVLGKTYKQGKNESKELIIDPSTQGNYEEEKKIKE